MVGNVSRASMGSTLEEDAIMSHMKPLGKQGPQLAIVGEICLGNSAFGQTADQYLVSKGKPAYFENICIPVSEM